MLAYIPAPLGRIRRPFDHPDWLFELKYDGFRAIAILEHGRCALVSRNGNRFASFSELATHIGDSLPARSAVLDGEIVCLDRKGRPQFNQLLFRRGTPTFVAFDLLSCNGTDLRPERLEDRKFELRRLLGPVRAPVVYANHVDQHGTALFQKTCELDLEGIVAKHQTAPYPTSAEQTTWFKIRNPRYSQWEGRHELFERDRHREPVPGWHTCELAREQTENVSIES